MSEMSHVNTSIVVENIKNKAISCLKVSEKNISICNNKSDNFTIDEINKSKIDQNIIISRNSQKIQIKALSLQNGDEIIK